MGVGWGRLLCLIGATALVGSYLGRMALVSAPLHEDEAIYAAWALQVRADPFLSHVWVDKPPLTFYPVALALALFGPQDWAARLPNIGWTALSGWAIFHLVRARRGTLAGWASVCLFGAAPLTLSYAPSVFTDPGMLALILLASVAAQRQHATAAGIAVGLALLAKPTALFLLPWVLAEGHATCPGAHHGERLWGLGMGALAVSLGAWAWDAARYAPSWWLLGQRAYGTLGVPAWEPLAWHWWLTQGLGALLVALVSVWGIETLWGILQQRGTWVWHRRDWALWLTLALFVPAHALLGFQPWDRYLLPLAALLALAAGTSLRHPERAALLAAVLAWPVVNATITSSSGLGGRDGRWAAMPALAAQIQALPPSVLVTTTTLQRPLAFYASQREVVWVAGVAAAQTLARQQGRLAVFAGRSHEVPPTCEVGPTGFVLLPVDDPCFHPEAQGGGASVRRE